MTPQREGTNHGDPVLVVFSLRSTLFSGGRAHEEAPGGYHDHFRTLTDGLPLAQ